MREARGVGWRMDAGKGSAAEPVIVERALIHRGRKFDFEMLTVRRAGGKTQQREIVRHPGAVLVVAVMEGSETDPARRAGVPGPGKSLVLIRNYRIAVGQRLLECCAGTIERERVGAGAEGFKPREDPKECAARELVEETGYRAATLTPLGWFYTTPGLTDEQMFVFVGTGLTFVGQNLEEDEAIDVEVVPVEEVLEMVRKGEMRDAKSMLGVLMARGAGLI